MQAESISTCLLMVCRVCSQIVQPMKCICGVPALCICSPLLVSTHQESNCGPSSLPPPVVVFHHCQTWLFLVQLARWCHRLAFFAHFACAVTPFCWPPLACSWIFLWYPSTNIFGIPNLISTCKHDFRFCPPPPPYLLQSMCAVTLHLLLRAPFHTDTYLS